MVEVTMGLAFIGEVFSFIGFGRFEWQVSFMDEKGYISRLKG
jgi:hypothetical protein